MTYFFNALLTSVFLFMTTALVGQHSETPVEYILTEGNNKYHFEGNSYNYNELSVFFDRSPELMALSEKVKMNKSGATVLE